MRHPQKKRGVCIHLICETRGEKGKKKGSFELNSIGGNGKEVTALQKREEEGTSRTDYNKKGGGANSIPSPLRGGEGKKGVIRIILEERGEREHIAWGPGKKEKEEAGESKGLLIFLIYGRGRGGRSRPQRSFHRKKKKGGHREAHKEEKEERISRICRRGKGLHFYFLA